MILDASTFLADHLREWSDDSVRGRFRRAFSSVGAWEPVVAPAIAFYEVGHTLFRKRRDATQDPPERLRLLRDLVMLVQEAALGGDDYEETGRICESAKISFYDAAYLAAARRLAQPLLTADGGMHAHALALGIRSYLMPQDLDRLEADYPSADAPRNA